ncbi:MAG TPA: glycosyltransferase family 4 protein, partial [Candidatus Limnocylindria bacterium]|nr:glycosyltransferase family 4 protein [Candidatus Limnocylindria bacterium]
PPMIPIPPPAYSGTERVIAVLAEELQRRGHRVTLFASGDSESPGELVAVLPDSTWKHGGETLGVPPLVVSTAVAWREQERFDIIHSHVEAVGFLFARHATRPVVSTLHGRLDVDGMPALLEEFSDVPLVAISDSQRRWSPDANWAATIHHGLPLSLMPANAEPGDYLLFVGRTVPEKGVAEAVEVALASGVPLTIVAKVNTDEERACFEDVIQPRLDDGDVQFLGELAPQDRDPLLAGALATLMLGAWPEPFGLVAIESLGTGTPVIARRAGALPEIIEHGVDGFLVDDVTEAQLAVEAVRGLDRALIRQRAVERFSTERMTDEYEALFRRLVSERRPG